MSDTLMQIAIMSLFPIIGGAVAGRNLRMGIRHGWSCNLLGGIVWGMFFGGLPLLFGIFKFLETGSVYLVAIQLLVLLGSFVVVSVASDWVLETFNPQVFGPILFGGLFMVVGVVLFLSLRGDSIRDALIALAVFGGAGAFVLILSAVKALKS